MPRRSVVLEPPGRPGKRQAVVLRAGPPAGGRRVDTAIGALGVVLLVVSVVLIDVLAEDEPLAPQFRVFVLEEEFEYKTRIVNLTEADDRVDLTFEVASDNVYSVNYELSFRDDIGTSLPDNFTVTLFDWRGEVVGSPFDINNEGAPPERDPQNPPFGFNAQWIDFAPNPGYGTLPQEQIVSGLPGEDADDVQRRLAAELAVPSLGNWTLRIQLVDAGDCPVTGDPDRALACRLEAGDGVDPGNPITVAFFKYRYFSLQVVPLGE